MEIEKYYTGKDGFENHEMDHNIMSNFCYVFYLKDKNESDYNSINTYVRITLYKESINWLPVNR